MANKRTVAKYAALGAVTTAYAGGMARLLKSGGLEQAKEQLSDRSTVTPKQVAMVGGGLLALTWLAGLL